MILTRILAPDQFGLMALVLAANGLFETLTEVGIGQSVIQNKNGDTHSYLSAAWIFSSVRGIILYGVGIIAAPWLAAFYESPNLTPLLRVAFMAMLFHGLTNPRLYVFQKKMTFGRYVVIMQGAGILGTSLCLILAFWISNIWALVVGYVVEAGLACCLSYLLCPFRFVRDIPKENWRDIISFSKGMAGLGLFAYIFMSADIILMGRICSKEVLGMYSMAFSLAAIPQILFTRIAGPMILPTLSDSQDQIELVRSRLLRMTRVLYSFGLPMGICLSVFSDSVLRVVYGSQYAKVAIAFGILNLYAIVYIGGILIASTYLALGRPDVHRTFTIVRVVILAILLYPCIQLWGPAGAAGSRIICLVIAGSVQLINLSRLIQLPIIQYIETFKEGVCLSMVLVVPALFISRAVESRVIHLILAFILCGIAWGYLFWKSKERIWVLLFPQRIEPGI